MSYDLAIIGGGSAAFAAAIHARRKDLRVIMIERDQVGGTCVNVGCIPSKALLAAAEARHVAHERRFPGIDTAAGPVQMAAVVGGKNEIVIDLRQDKYLDLARDYGWDLVQGAARFAPGPVLEIDGRRIEARHYIVATGSSPWVPPIDGLDDVPYLTSTTAMELDEIPDSLIVVGGNYIGLEMGQLFARLGSRVTLIEALDRIAPHEEPEISEALSGVLRDEGLTLRIGSKVGDVRRENGDVVATVYDNGGSDQVRASRLLIATGRRPETSGLALDSVGVKLGKSGEVVVNHQLRTANPRIWAIGDVTGRPQFVYVAGVHGAVAVDNAFDNAARTVDYRTLPRVTFTTPHIASVGMTEADTKTAGIECECRSIPLAFVPRALVNRDTRGLVKIVAESKTGVVRGVHMLAPNAGDSILAGVYAIEFRMTVNQIANIWCPYLTVSEGIKLAAQAFTMDIAKLSCCGT
jgi:mercuric reductase